MDFLAILREERARAKALKAGQNLNEGGNESKKGQKSPPKSAAEISLNVELTLPPAESRKDFELLDSGDLVYFPRVVSEGGEKALLDAVNKQAEIQSWTVLTGRKSMMCGNHHNASGGSVSQSLPVWLQGLCNQLPFFDKADKSKAVNHVLINSYQAADGEIAFHTDGPSYLPMVCILSLGGPVILSFRERVRTEDIGVKEDLGDIFKVIMMPGSLLLFKGDAYENKLHGIDRESVLVDGKCLNRRLCPGLEEDGSGSIEIVRGARTSLTIRHALSE